MNKPSELDPLLLMIAADTSPKFDSRDVRSDTLYSDCLSDACSDTLCCVLLAASRKNIDVRDVSLCGPT